MKNRTLIILSVLLLIFSIVLQGCTDSFAAYVANETEVTNELSSSAAFYAGASRAACETGARSLAAPPYLQESQMYVPVLDMGSMLGITITSSGNGTYANGVDITAFTQIQNGVKFVSIAHFASATGLHIFDDELSDLVVISKNHVSYTWHDDRSILSGIIGTIVFDYPTADKITSDVEARYPYSGHPRLLATEGDFERIRQESGIIDSEIFVPLKKQWYNDVKNHTAYYSSQSTITYGPTDGIRMRRQSQQFYNVAARNAFMYKLTGDEAYAQRAWTEISAVCDFPDWNPCHLLDMGQFANGMALCYDWLYDWLSDTQKSRMRDSIVQKSIKVMQDVFDGKTVYSAWNVDNNGNLKGRNYGDWAKDGVSNWTFVCTGGAVMAALAVFDDCDSEAGALCESVLEQGVLCLFKAATAYSPSGDWYEGPSYWALATETMTEACASLESSAGTDYGIMNVPGVSLTGEYPFSMIGKYSFNYSNASEYEESDIPNTRELFYHARRFGRQDYANARFRLMDKYDLEADFRDLIYCVHDFCAEDIVLPPDSCFKNSETVTMRNTSADEGLIFAALHGGANEPAQGHLDVGQFVIDSFGSRFASDLGSENYDLEISYYKKYRNRAEGHNTLVINPDDRVYDQSGDAVGIIKRYESNEASSLAVLDMTSAYIGYADSVTRAMKMTNDRTQIILRDEVRGIAERDDGTKELYWFMHTKADITLSDDGKTAILDKNGNKMYVSILSDDDSVFGVMDAVRLPTSPEPEVDGENLNEEFCKLYIHYTDISDVNISVCFTPEIYYDAYDIPDCEAISDWELDSINSVYQLPKLDSIMVNGSSIEAFSPNKNYYIYKLEDTNIPIVSAGSDSEVSIILPDAIPGTAQIKAIDEHGENLYTVEFVIQDSFAAADYEKFNVINMMSGNEHIYKTIDGISQTTAVFDNGETVVCDLGELRNISYVNIDGENLNAEISVSSDGIDYAKLADACGDNNVQYYAGGICARYIKLTALSDNVTISELSFYGYSGYEYFPLDNQTEKVLFYAALFDSDTNELKKLVTKTLPVCGCFSVSELIDIPRDGNQYRISAFIWQDGNIVPLMPKTEI